MLTLIANCIKRRVHFFSCLLTLYPLGRYSVFIIFIKFQYGGFKKIKQLKKKLNETKQFTGILRLKERFEIIRLLTEKINIRIKQQKLKSSGHNWDNLWNLWIEKK